jgi:hypothetical protein
MGDSFLVIRTAIAATAAMGSALTARIHRGEVASFGASFGASLGAIVLALAATAATVRFIFLIVIAVIASLGAVAAIISFIFVVVLSSAVIYLVATLT